MNNVSFQDELEKVSIDQLHKAVLQLSKNCFEIKKLCATVLVSASALIATFTNKQLDLFIFIAGNFVISFFWILDGQSYYYQEKLRARMKTLAEDIAHRHSPKLAVDGVGMPLSEKREQRKLAYRTLTSLFNVSMLFYLVLAVLIVILGFLYHYGYIQSLQPTSS